MRPTWTYSTTLLSPRSRLAETLVAGNASGTTFRTIRFREFVTVKDEIVTAFQAVSIYHGYDVSVGVLTPILVPQIQRRGILNSAGGCAHLRFFPVLPHHTLWSFRSSENAREVDAIERCWDSNQYHLGGWQNDDC